MILTQAQAEAVYSAMCALNNVTSNSGTEISFVSTTERGMARFTVTESAGGEINVTLGPVAKPQAVECFDHQAAFAAAYGLQQG